MPAGSGAWLCRNGHAKMTTTESGDHQPTKASNTRLPDASSVSSRARSSGHSAAIRFWPFIERPLDRAGAVGQALDSALRHVASNRPVHAYCPRPYNGCGVNPRTTNASASLHRPVLGGTLSSAVAGCFWAYDERQHQREGPAPVAEDCHSYHSCEQNERANAVDSLEHKGVQDVAAVELADRYQVEPRDEDSNPAGISQRMQQHVLILGQRPERQER